MPRPAHMTKPPHARAKRVGVVLLTAVCTAFAVTVVGSPDMQGPAVAAGAVGTTVGSAQYPVPAGAIIVSPSGNDAAAGTTSAPVATLGRAVAIAPSGSTIVARAGTYHESVTIPSNKRLTVQSWPGEAVWLDGSVPVAGWSAASGRWRAAWNVRFDHSPTYTRGAPDNTAASWSFINPAYPMAAHPDQIWINGVAQRQVASLAQVGSGSFFYDEGAGQLWLGTDPGGKDVRATNLVRALMVRSDGSTVRGLGIRRYSPSVPDMGAVTIERADVLVENVAITDTSTTALHVGSSYDTSGVVLRNLHVARNGMLGLSATNADNITLDQVLSENNNTENFNTAPVSGGAKLGRLRGAVVRNSVFRNNLGPGIWFDESVYDMRITGNEIRNNGKHGISLELSSKATVSDNTIAGNKGYGIKVNNTSTVTIANNTFVGNDRSINIVQDGRTPATDPGRDPRQPYPDPTMTWLNGPVTVTNNVLSNQQSGNCMLCVEDYTRQRTAEQIGVTANGNVYARPNASTPTAIVIWSRGAANAAVFNDLASFRAATGQEATGSQIIGSTPPPPPPTTPTTAAPTPPPPPTTAAPPPPPPPTTAAPPPPPPPTTPTTAAPEPPALPTQHASDVFSRTIANGLGRADIGGPWTISGAAENFSVANGGGRIVGSVGSTRSGYLYGVDKTGVDILTDATLDTAPSGGGAYVSVVGRRVSSGNSYSIKLRYLPGGSVAAYLIRSVGGAETVLAWRTVPGLSVAPGETLRIRLVVSGGYTAETSSLHAAVWKRNSAGPENWLLATIDRTPSVLEQAGSVGVSLYTSRSWSGRAGAITVDNYVVRSPAYAWYR